jgi:cardiolipin synthase
MLHAITGAQSSVRLEIYMVKDSPIGDRFREALTEAARRSVAVRLIVDAVGSYGLARDYFAGMVAAGGGLRWFNELRMSSFSFRDHRKLLVVDETTAFVGGCNIASEYYGDGVTVGWRDGGASVRGPVVAALAVGFDHQWERANQQRWDLSTGGLDWRAVAHKEHAVEALFIKPGFARNPLKVALRRDLAGAKEVAITSAYFLPTHWLRRQLAQVVARGHRVRLLLAGQNDVPLIQLAARSLYRRLLNKGLEIWEYQPQILHAKLIIIDDIVYVGSANLDQRSLRINFEITLRIRDAAFAAAARTQFESDLSERARPVTRAAVQREHSWWQRLKQRFAYWLFARLDAELATARLHVWRRRKDRLMERVQGVRTRVRRASETRR